MTDETDEKPASDLKPNRPTRVIDRSKALGGLSKSEIGDLLRKQSDSTAQIKALIGSSALEQLRASQSIASSLALAQQSTEQLTDWSRLSNPIGQALSSLADGRQRMLDAIRPKWDMSFIGSALSETMRQFHSSGVLAVVEGARQSHLDAIGHIHRDLLEATKAWREHLPSFSEIGENLRRLPKRVRENLVALAEAGWYPDSEMPVSDLIEFKEELALATPDEINHDLAGYFRSSLDRIEAELVERHPTRARFIKIALAAHRAGDYSLSIPALFAQADGICLHRTGHQLYTKKGPNKFAKRLDAETFERAYLEPLLRETPITASARRRVPSDAHLNRHAVMHGESVDYDSELNGLKAISFLNFVSYVMTRGDEQDESNTLETIEVKDDL